MKKITNIADAVDYLTNIGLSDVVPSDIVFISLASFLLSIAVLMVTSLSSERDISITRITMTFMTSFLVICFWDYGAGAPSFNLRGKSDAIQLAVDKGLWLDIKPRKTMEDDPDYKRLGVEYTTGPQTQQDTSLLWEALAGNRKSNVISLTCNNNPLPKKYQDRECWLFISPEGSKTVYRVSLSRIPDYITEDPYISKKNTTHGVSLTFEDSTLIEKHPRDESNKS